MKLTKSKLKQIIKEVYDSKAAAGGDYDYDAGAGHKAHTDEWGKHTVSDALKHSKKAWFSSHWRDQILQKIEDGEPIPPDHVWRRLRRELDGAGIYRPGPEADALIDKILADMRQEDKQWGGHNLKAIPAYWTRPINENKENNNMKLTKSKLKQMVKEELVKILESKYKVGDMVMHDSENLGKGRVVAVSPGAAGVVIVKWVEHEGKPTKRHHRWALKPAGSEMREQ